MSRGWTQKRAALFAGGSVAGPARRGAAVLVGRDFSRRGGGGSLPAGWLLHALVGAVAAALLLTGLHVSIMRLRYQLGEAIAQEDRLLERKRAATVVVRELRDPARLHRLAGDLGLVRPDRVIALALPPPPTAVVLAP